MANLLALADGKFHLLVEWGILVLEFFGTVVLLVTAIVSMYKWLRRRPDVRTTISQGILLALAFKMGGEVLRTVIATETRELVSIFAIILLRGLVAAMIYWEITKEAKIEAMYNGGKLPERRHKHAEEPEKEAETVTET